MLEMAIVYRRVIDDITANKALKLRKYELDDEEWQIVSDLLRVLKVCTKHLLTVHSLTYKF
jgi:hypothetical protein